MKKTDTKRDQNWDVIRGLGIICVVLGHCLPYCYWTSFVFLFHMGLFFFISGYFLKKDGKASLNSLIRFVISKIKSLWFPWVIANLLCLCFQNWFVDWNMAHISYHGIDAVKMVVKILMFGSVDNPILYPLWFLKSLFVGVIICYIVVNFIESQKKQIFIIGLLSAIGYVLGALAIKIPINMTANLIICSVIYMGYFAKLFIRDNRAVNLANVGKYAFFLSLVILFFSAFFVHIDVNNGKFCGLLFQIFTLIGIVFCFYISKMFIMRNKFIVGVFTFIGLNSFYIFILHVAAFKLVSFFVIYLYDLPYREPSRNLYNQIVADEGYSEWWIAYAIVGLGLPSLFVIMKNKFKNG